MDFIFPAYPLRIEHRDGKPWVWDIIRKKWLVLQKEEYVRQHLVHYLIEARGIPAGRIGVEKMVHYGTLKRRFDLVVFDRSGQPFILCECKAPEVALGEAAFLQIARYNREIQAPHLLLTNGAALLFFSLDAEGQYQHQPSGWYPEPA